MYSKIDNPVRFIPLCIAMHQLGASSLQAFLTDFRSLTNQERRDVANFVEQEKQA